MIVYCAGEFRREERAAIPIDDPGFLSADGVFETALLYQGGFVRLRQHLERFAASAALMRIPTPPLDTVDAIVRAVVQQNQLRDANIRITLTRGTDTPLLLVTARPIDESRLAKARAGWRIITAQTRRPAVSAVPAQLKALGRTYALLARHEAAEAGADDALLLNDQEYICEGPTWNIFWRTAQTLYTPALEAGVLAGVTRSIIIENASRAGLAVQEGLFRRADLDHADEIFASMTSAGIVPIRSIDGRALPTATPAANSLHNDYMHRLGVEAAADPA